MSLPTHTHNGRAYEVLAKFYDPDRVAQANAYMAKTPGACVLCDDRGCTIIVHNSDKGVPVLDAADSGFGERGWTPMVKVKTSLESK